MTMSIAEIPKSELFNHAADVTFKHRTHAGETHGGDARA